ncbi:MAG: hypothetical protein OCD02_22075 [Spirochaetaceae bacterium]
MRYLILILQIIVIHSIIFSYQWPSNKDYLESLFGSIHNNSVQDGIKFNSENQAIYPLTDGEIIYYQDSFLFGDLNYSGEEGNLLVVEHVGEFKSIYRNFSSTENFDFLTHINKDEMIGISKKEYDDFIFSVYDDKKDAYINPQQILPFLEDGKSPIINAVYLRNKDQNIKLTRNKIVPTDDYTVYVDVWDLIKIGDVFKRFTPFSINIFIDGFERHSGIFSSIKEIDNILYLSGETDIPLNNFLTGNELFYGGEAFLTRGRSLVEIVVRDIEGNEASKSYSLVIE